MLRKHSLGCLSPILLCRDCFCCFPASNSTRTPLQRGVGKQAVGSSLTLVAPKEDKAHGKVAGALDSVFSLVQLDGRILRMAQERVNLATKVTAVESAERKSKQSDQWFRSQAAQADIELEDDVLEGSENSRDERDRVRVQQGKAAKAQLSRMLRSQSVPQQWLENI